MNFGQKMIQDLITHYRNQLNALEDGILIGEIADGAKNFDTQVETLLTQEHKDFLKICDGGFFGDVVLWSSTEILENQYRVSDDVKDTMYEIGQILYEPIFMNKITKNVYFDASAYQDMADINVSFMKFVQEYIFGDKYRTHILGSKDKDDDWSLFLTENAP